MFYVWIKLSDETHKIISCNTVCKDKSGEVWITRPNGKSLKVYAGKIEHAKEIKSAIDYAIENNKNMFVLG